MNALATSLRLPCGVTLPNRLVKSAMAEGLATEHRLPTRRHERLYETWARGGSGLIVTGNVMVDPHHRTGPGDVAIRPDARRLFRAWAASVTRHGVPVLMQLNHPGRQAPRASTPEPVAPSAVAAERSGFLFAPPRSLTASEIEGLVDRFAAAAAFAERAGFTGVEVHAAHGYLVSQFLSPKTNVRRDAWAGSPEHRARFLVEIVRAIRRRTGRQFILAVKLNSTDFLRDGFDVEASLRVAHWLQDEGIDLLEVTGGTYESDALLGQSPRRRSSGPYFVEYVRALRPTFDIPLLVTGGNRNARAMEQRVASGVHDLVGLARPLALLPDLPARIVRGERPTVQEPSFPRVPGLVSALVLRWYTSQLHRLADGEPPRQRVDRLRTLAETAGSWLGL